MLAEIGIETEESSNRVLSSKGKRMSGSQILRAPSECSDSELDEFERLVRLGFEGSDDTLSIRVRAAHRLAFRVDHDVGVVAIAALKRPRPEFTAEVFSKAGCSVAPDDWRRELGWVFVAPPHRKAGYGRTLCEQLLRQLGNEPVYATTRPDNSAMIRILESLRFEQHGGPFMGRRETLLVYLRSAPMD